MFKKTDSKELERTITIVLCVLFVCMPIAYLVQLCGLVTLDDFEAYIELGEVVLVIGALILLMFDSMYMFQKDNRFLTVLDILIILYAVSVVISIFTAKDVGLAITGNYMTNEGGVALLSYLVILFSASLITDEKNRRILYFVMIAVGLLQFVTGVMQAVFHMDIMVTDRTINHINNSRAFGTITNPNPYGSVMVIFAGLEYGLLFGAKNKKGFIIHALLSVVFTYCIILSGTRGSWVGLAFTSFICSIIAIIKGKKDFKISEILRRLSIVLACVLLSILCIIVTSKSTIDDVKLRNDIDTSNGTFGEDRLLIWDNAFKLFLNERPVIGLGVSNLFMPVNGFTAEDEEDDEMNRLVIYFANDAHSRYLNIMCTQGIVGIVTYLALIGYIFIFAIKRIKNILNEHVSLFALWIAGLGYLIADAFCICQIYMAPFFFLVLGLLISRADSKHLLGKKQQ